MDTMESMVGDLVTGIPDTWWGTHTWWGAHIHGVEPTYMVAWPASRPALVGGQVGGPGGRAGPARGVSGMVSGILERGWNLDPSIGTSIVRFSPSKGPISFHPTFPICL